VGAQSSTGALPQQDAGSSSSVTIVPPPQLQEQSYNQDEIVRAMEAQQAFEASQAAAAAAAAAAQEQERREREKQSRELEMWKSEKRVFKEGMERRNEEVKRLIESEERFVMQLQGLSDFLASYLNKQRRLSRRMSRNTISSANIDGPNNVSSSLSLSLQQGQQGMQHHNHNQLEAEHDTLALLLSILHDLLTTHQTFVTDLKAALDQIHMEPDLELGVGVPIGDAMVRFVSDLTSSGVYATFGVIGFGAGSVAGVGGSGQTKKKSVVDEILKVEKGTGMAETSGGFASGFLERVVECFGKEERYLSGKNGGGEGGVVTEEMWRWYLSRPLKRLGMYVEVCGRLEMLGLTEEEARRYFKEKKSVVKARDELELDVAVVEKEKRRVLRDGRRLQVAGAKLRCLADAVLGKLSLEEGLGL
jgi:hypothetical protein